MIFIFLLIASASAMNETVNSTTMETSTNRTYPPMRVHACYVCIPDNGTDCFDPNNLTKMRCAPFAGHACVTVYSAIGQGVRGCTSHEGCPESKYVHCCFDDLCNGIEELDEDAKPITTTTTTSEWLALPPVKEPPSHTVEKLLVMLLLLLFVSIVVAVGVFECCRSYRKNVVDPAKQTLISA